MHLTRPGPLAALARSLPTVTRLPHRMARWATPSHRGGAALRIVVLLAAFTGQARAQRFDVDRPRPETTREPAAPTVPAAPAKPSGPPPQGWYGLGGLSSDLAAGILVGVGATKNIFVAFPGYLAYLLGGPINHAAHGQTATAGISLGLRVLPLTVAALLLEDGFGQLISDDQSCQVECEAFIGAAVVAPAVLALFDDLSLANYPEPPGNKPASPSSPSLSWSPVVTPRREGGLSLGVVGRF